MSRIAIFDRTGEPDVLHIVDEPIVAPSSGEVRIRLEAVGVNRLDSIMRSGGFPRPFRLPHARLGCEGTGVVDAIGDGVDNLRVGDAVIITAIPDMDIRGTYADYTVVPAANVIERPADVDSISAAALWVSYSTAYGALIETAEMRPADTVLITAASSTVGLAAIQIARHIGARPIAVTRTDTKRQALLDAGAVEVIVSEETSVVGAAREYTDGRGVDIILDLVMGPGLAELATAAKPSGTLITAGWLDPEPPTMPMAAPLTIHRYMSFEHTLNPVVVRRIAAFLTAGLRTGALAPTIAATFELSDVVRAHEMLERNQHLGKLVITIDS